jgi:hypothetical protein
MRELRYTLVTNGSSDTALLPILTWLLRTHGVSCAIQPEWADLRQLRLSKKRGLADRIDRSLNLYPCDLLFVHRDAEREPREKSVDEINGAIEKVGTPHSVPPAVCVVPVRMQEAWLLFDEAAIRHAAGNRSGRQPIDLPPVRQLEQLSDPKTRLHDCLKQASDLRGRRLKNFPVHKRARRLAELIDDFSPLRALSAFKTLESDLAEVIERQSWA